MKQSRAMGRQGPSHPASGKPWTPEVRWFRASANMSPKAELCRCHLLPGGQPCSWQFRGLGRTPGHRSLEWEMSQLQIFFFNFLSFYENNTGTECKMGFKLKCIESGNTAFSVEGKSCLIRTQHMPKCPCGEHTHGRQGQQCIIMQCGNRRCDLLSLSLKCTPAVNLASDQARCDRFSVLHCLCLSVHLQPGL